MPAETVDKITSNSSTPSLESMQLGGITGSEEAVEEKKSPISIPGAEAVPVEKEKVEEAAEAKPEEAPVAPAPVEKAAPEVSEPQVEAKEPRTLEDVVGDFNKQANERLAGLAVEKEPIKLDKSRLLNLISQKNRIETAVRRPKKIAQEMETIGREIEELKALQPGEELIIKAVGTRINVLRREKERKERELEKARQEEADLIGTPEELRQAQAAYGAYERLIEEEKKNLLSQARATKTERQQREEQYNREEQGRQKYSQRLETWQDYLENEGEIRTEERNLERDIAVMDGKVKQVEETGDKEKRKTLADIRASDKRRLTLLRKRIPEDVAGFKAEPESEIERMYREAVEEMKKIKEEKVEEVEKAEKVEEPKKELSEEEKATQAREHWQVVMGLVVTEGVFKESLTDKEKEVLERKLNSLEELSSFPEKIEKLRVAYGLSRKEE